MTTSRLTFHVPRYLSPVTYATLLVAFFLRAYRLADKNIWWDEGWSIWLSQKDIAWITLRTAADEHPPLHYWMLHFWNFVAGTDAFAGRFISLAFGVLTIALIYRIGKRVGGAWVGVLTALFLAAARFHIWWSQDIKNYTPSIFFAFAAVWFGLCVIASEAKQSPSHEAGIASAQKPRLAMTKSGIGYALCAALALWTHYLAALVLLAVNLYALFIIAYSSLVLRRPSSVIRSWIIANLLAAALFAPWLYLYLQNAAAWTAAPAFDFALFLKLVATVLPLGVTTNIDNYAVLTIVFTVIAVLGCIPQKAENTKQKAENTQRLLPTTYYLLPTLVVLLPPLLIYLLSLTPVSFFAPKIQARYLLILLPGYVMLLALGITFLSRFSRPFAAFVILFVLGANAFVLNDYYADRHLRDDYATLANTINAFAQQGDLVLLDTDQEWPTFLYYLRAPLDWLGAPNGKAMDADNADLLARRALNRNSAVWLVTIPDALATDPQRLLEARLARDLSKQYERTIDDKRLALYAPAPRDFINVAHENFAPQYPHGEEFGDTLKLLGFDLPTREINAGDVLRVVTYWSAKYDPATVPISIVDLVSTDLQIPTGGPYRFENDFAIPPTAHGDYSLTVLGHELARVSVAPRGDNTRVGEITHRVDYRLGDTIHLIGYDLPQTKFRAGETVVITLYWRADRQVEKSYTVFAQIVGEQFNPKQNNPLWGQVDRVPRDGSLPTTAWLPNEIVPDAYTVNIDPNAPAGKYKIVVGMYDAATGTRLAVNGGNDSIVVAEIEIVP